MDKDAELDIREKMMEYGQETLSMLKHNIATQKMWPALVYPRYDEINKIREKYGSWYSTGDAISTMRFVLKNSKLSNMSDARMDFFINEYLRYVDIGVGKGRKAEDIERNRKARYKSRYAKKWDPTRGNTHRPSFMMEFRHLQRTLAWYLMSRYGFESSGYIMSGFEDLIAKADGENIR